MKLFVWQDEHSVLFALAENENKARQSIITNSIDKIDYGLLSSNPEIIEQEKGFSFKTRIVF